LYADSFRWYRSWQNDLSPRSPQRRRYSSAEVHPKQLITFTANLQTLLIGMEACSGAHFLGRTLREQGHDVRLIQPQFVKPFVKSNKNDFLDAEAIAEQSTVRTCASFRSRWTTSWICRRFTA